VCRHGGFWRPLALADTEDRIASVTISPLSRWNDDRLDDLNGRVRDMEPTARTVAVLEQRMQSLSAQLRENTKGQERIAKQFEQAQLEPLTRARSFRQQLTIAVIAALAGGGLAVFGALIAGAH
jgi:hypothetical protein